MKEETEKVLLDLAYTLAETVITTSILNNKGVVHKNIPYIQDMDEKKLMKVPKAYGRDVAIDNIDIFNDILCNVLEKRLYWYNLEGFCEELEDCYRFFTKEEIEEKHKEIYGDNYGQD